MLLPGQDLPLVEALALWDFTIFSCQMQVKTKKVLSTCRASGTEPYVKSVLGEQLLHYDHKKVRSGPQLATFRTKALNFTWVMRLNWLVDIKLKGPRLPETILLLGDPFKLGPFKYYCRGHF